jgi:hypothetical protein
MKKFLYLISILFLLVTFVNIIGVIALNTKSRTLKTFFGYYNEIRNGLKSNNSRLINLDTNSFVNNLNNEKLYYTNARFVEDKWVIELMALGNKNVIYSWSMDENTMLRNQVTNKRNRKFSHSEPRSPYILKDKSCVFYFEGLDCFFRVDSNSNIIWSNNEHRFHHTFNVDEQTIWVCTREMVNRRAWENYVVALDINTGKTVFRSSPLSKLFLESNNYWLLGNSNTSTPKGNDPYHLNDVEVVKSDAKHWKKGDLFLSLRHRSSILHYRPNVDSILSVICGPFAMQHDVDILSDSQISVFNNNVDPNIWGKYHVLKGKFNLSNICVYNFNSRSFSYPIKDSISKQGIFTKTQGLHEICPDGSIFVESQNNGVVYYFKKSGELMYRGVLNNINERTHWPRLYHELPF